MLGKQEITLLIIIFYFIFFFGGGGGGACPNLGTLDHLILDTIFGLKKNYMTIDFA